MRVPVPSMRGSVIDDVKGDPRVVIVTLLSLALAGCGGAPSEPLTKADTAPAMRLEILGAERTGITFRNNVIEDDSANYFNYTYMYNGGGVSAGDLDGDDLPDLVFVSNRNGGAIYKNLDGMKFKDVSKEAGFDLGHTWATGITLVDVNADGRMDIYVCASGPEFWSVDTRRNKLFINDGQGHFSERAAEFGLADEGHSTMAYFADLDGDVDLDCFIVGHRVDFQGLRQAIIDPRFQPVPDQSDRLYLNDGKGHFSDHTEESGLASRRFGLAAAVGDLDQDGRNDIYVANDFYTADQFMVNEGNDPRTGVPHFKDVALERLGHTSYFSMGVDRADYNNDGLPDLYVLDMTPSDHRLNKENMASMAPAQFANMVKFGFHYQYMVNTLQLNNGNGTWSEVGQLAGVDRTDWSWAPLFVDLDNDGWKDLFVTNGITRDVTNSDFRAEVKRIAMEEGTNSAFRPILELAPTHVPEKMVFRNTGDLTFEKAMDRWNFHQKTLSNGAAYADLDRDGDMDLVTVDVNAAPTVVRNLCQDTRSGHFLQLTLKGDVRNTMAIGSSATLYSAGGKQVCDLFVERGFQSSVEPLIHFGSASDRIDSVVITWPDRQQSVIVQPKVDQRLVVEMSKEQRRAIPASRPVDPLFNEASTDHQLIAQHTENTFDEFAVETLLPQRQGEHGPCAAVADVNGDGIDDLFIGASAGQTCSLFLQNTEGRFAKAATQPWTAFKTSEFIGAHFFDADGDKDADLYLAAGSTEFGSLSPLYQDRLFVNDGSGRFTEASGALPEMHTSTMAIASHDLDGDGDLDLFVGGRNEPGAWPAPPKSYVLINEGGRFSDATSTWLAGHDRPGMITSAVFADMDGDQNQELVLCGEWMPINAWKIDKGSFRDISSTLLDTSLIGWWQSITSGDIDGDGDLDLIAGNLGANNKFHPSASHPLKVYMSDLDGSGTNDIVLAKCGSDGELPVRGRECSSGQMPFIEDRFPTYKAFAGASLESIYGKENLQKAVQLRATTFLSTCFINNNGKFKAMPLPMVAQISPIRSAIVRDVDGDGMPDLIVAGNLYGCEVETTRYDSSIGLVLRGDGHGGFNPLSAQQSGISIPYDTRHVLPIGIGAAHVPALVAVNNNGPVQLFVLRDKADGTMMVSR